MKRVIEIAETDRHLALYRGFLEVKTDHKTIGRVPLDDIEAVILTAPDTSLSRPIMVALAERSISVLVCGKNFHPIASLQPLPQHGESAGTLHDQIKASLPLKKRLWQCMIRSKIEFQHAVLSTLERDANITKKLRNMVALVRSGDPMNLEAQAARAYWKALFGAQFRRDPDLSGLNARLNYGYAIVRASTARALCASGLQPSLGISHVSRRNAFALADDLMEPFRSCVDLLVADLECKGELCAEEKAELARVLHLDLDSPRGLSTLSTCLVRAAQTLVDSFQHGEVRLELPYGFAPFRQRIPNHVDDRDV